ncbi:MAG: nitrogen regulation protein NR(II) [Granulosicoccaceae bacterium]
MTTPASHPLLDSLSTATVQLDAQLTVRYTNTAAEQLLGINVSASIGKHIVKLVRLPESLIQRLDEALDTGQGFSDRHVTIERTGGDSVLVDCVITPHATNTGVETLIIELTSVDRHVRIARDAAIQHQQEYVQTMLRGMAHEIKNPLGGIRGAAQLLARELTSKDLGEYTDVIIKEADRLQALIDRMLGPASRPDSKTLNIHEVLEHVRKLVQAEVGSDVTLEIDYDPSIPELLGDRDRLTQVFLNILGNARHAVDDKGQILIKTRVITSHTIGGIRHPLVIKTDIIDNGPGIPDSLIDSIFYPMVSGRQNGTGLGLSIAQSIMAQLGGLIECSSQPGNTVLTTYLPLDMQ